MAVDVILPGLNEAPALPWTLARMPAGFRPIVLTGLLAATADLVCCCGGDGSLDPRQLPRLTGTVGETA